ncbi:tubulin epsilon chain-like isoform X2 [Hylaeus anthracinus]|uniref:tubulin epsilon chain-like isoform X2 n=1 Tax=Hylaeus anthracinus TaxID=313031 RepID=UPI0023B995D8|nr:tubulin epsilon chain-like isoform X2 [Hylaeus anthracinus]XP_054015574.1 tubulin epsilon chain-like isoform X2 [Hylaeus anthracinus]XP_054015575.1 tubulin epsilon chain-like isoform X2 [Hylaeus anthracinus]
MSQFITVQVGQCGNQIGSAFWPLVLHEYGIQSTNTPVNLLKTQRTHSKTTNDLCNAFHSFFSIPDNSHDKCFKTITDLKKAKVKARAILIDMEDSVIAGLKKGPLNNLFDETCIVTNYPGSGNNWAVGYYTHGTEYHDKLEDSIRRTVEKCCRLHGFLFMHSLGGGTGSGLGTATLKLIADLYPNVDRYFYKIKIYMLFLHLAFFRLVSCIYPTIMQDVVTAPYNALLATRELMEHATCVFPIENTSLLDICASQLNKKENMDQINYNVSCKPFQDMNSIVVNMLLHLTSGSRFPGVLNMDMNEIATNLVAYPKLQYIFSSVSPVALTAPTIYTMQGTKLQDELFVNAWSRKNQLIKVDPLRSSSVILSAAHIARGNCSMTDLQRNIERFQDKFKFTEWSREAMKLGLCSIPPAGHSASVLCLLNSTAMSSLFKNIINQFTTLYKRKAHVHHYTKVQGFEETYFTDSKETITNLVAQYAELQNRNQIDISRLKII